MREDTVERKGNVETPEPQSKAKSETELKARRRPGRKERVAPKAITIDLAHPDVEREIVTHKFSNALIALRAYCLLQTLRSGIIEALQRTQQLQPPRIESVDDFIKLCESDACERYIRIKYPYAVWHTNADRLKQMADVAIADLPEFDRWL